MTSKLNSSLHRQLCDLAKDSSGFAASEITGFSPEQVRRAAEALVKAEQLVRSEVAPRRVRYFADQGVANQYSSAKGAPATRASRAGTGARSRAAWRADEPGRITAKTLIYVAPPMPQNVFRTNTYPQF